jgi:hypothetical protein
LRIPFESPHGARIAVPALQTQDTEKTASSYTSRTREYYNPYENASRSQLIQELHQSSVVAPTLAHSVLRTQRHKLSPKTLRRQLQTGKVTFVYGGSQRYDIAKSVLTESVIVRNSGSETLKAPLRLEVDARSQRGLIWPLDVTTETYGPNTTQYLEIDQYLLGGDLPPGTSSVAIPLDFYFELYADAKPDDNAFANISLRLLAKQPK